MNDSSINRQEERMKIFKMRRTTFKERINFLKMYYPNYQPIGNHYDSLIRKHIKPKSILLDAGCGWKSSEIENLSDSIKNNITMIGMDIDLEALKDNVTHKNLLCSRLEKIPFKDKTFDIIISKCVIEHVKYPQIAINEFSRITKKGGHIIMVVPNIYNPLMLAGKLTPLRLHKKFMTKISNVKEDDIYHTYFRCNSIRSIDRIFKNAGFVRKDLKISGEFILLMFSKPLFFSWIIFDKMTNYGILKYMKSNICVCYRKEL